ncbi:MAG: hypothetical protein IKX30_01945 [Victivallales bacterium]|nr:hypothetical protein [Victivallales bacterium]MBR5077479.1 hypothetical protein [Victivallales bacterium]
MNGNLPKVRHVQTLVEMNHCVGTARRDAAFDNLEEYCEAKLMSARVRQRKHAYAYCLYLVNEALTAAEHSALVEEKQGMLDRPATHFLKLLQDMASTMEALANHVMMVEQEAELLHEALGDNVHKLLSESCDQFVKTEAAATKSFISMLSVGKELLKVSTQRHREHFSEDDERRYNLCYNEYKRHYAEMLQKRRRENAAAESHEKVIPPEGN